MTHAMVVRPDNVGDVLLAGPAVRAVAADVDRVSFWAGPNGAAAAALLPGVDEVIVHRADWIDPAATGVDRGRVMAFVDELRELALDEAIILTSFHQSPLPAALLLRLACVPTIAAVSNDYPGALLDVRHRVGDDSHEVERALSLVATLGHRLPPGDHGGLAVAVPPDIEVEVPDGADLVVVHPGASVPARAWAPGQHRETVTALRADGWRVLVTGGAGERDLTAFVADGVDDLGGRTSLAELAVLVAHSAGVITGNTGPAHLAAAVGTPVVSLYAPTVPPVRWRPWGVAHVLLGELDIACAGCRSHRCPLPGHPCLDDVTPGHVVAALRRVVSDRDAVRPPLVTDRDAVVVLGGTA